MSILKSKTFNKLAKNLTVVAALILSISIIFFASKGTSTIPTQDCKDVASPQAGNNCLYFSLPLCSEIPYKTWNYADPAVILTGETTSPRTNCADLSDLPLCSQLSDNGATTNPGRNCVKECKDPSFDGGNGTRGQNYAVHNRDCVRFCDDVEDGITAKEGQNCKKRYCHQIPEIALSVPSPGDNCGVKIGNQLQQLSCAKLTPDELNSTKFRDEAKANYKYCNNDEKCYNFSKEQLPYVVPFRMCKMHQCRVPCIDNAKDDVQTILNKGSDYANSYKTLINSNYEIGSASEPFCQPYLCKPIIKKDWKCTDSSIANPNCDKSGDGSVCSSGHCYQTIDCNNSVNANVDDCKSVPEEAYNGLDEGSLNSWLYRPRPLPKMLNGNSAVLNEAKDMCYSFNEMKNLGWGKGGCWLGMCFYSVADVLSPKACNTTDLGIRGNGYSYLCGINFNPNYATPHSFAGYHRGYATATFTNDEAINTETVCLRFNAFAASNNTCGKRQCQVFCMEAFGSKTCTQICGSDVCFDLKVKSSNPSECMMNNDRFYDDAGNPAIGVGSTNKDCMKTVDGYMRVRAVKYGDYICNFLDVKGTPARSEGSSNYTRYFDGSEKVIGGKYCVSGNKDNNDNCAGGKDTNSAPLSLLPWRTVMQIPYIQNNQPLNKPAGYLDFENRLFPQQECIKVPQRIGAPRLYNLANIGNSSRIFVPPLYILNASIKRGLTIAVASQGEDFGETDFHYPEITVNFGETSQKLSLGFGKTGYEDGGAADPQGSATITTEISAASNQQTNGTLATYSKEVFVRKEFDASSQRPTFCLYQRVQDANGTYLDPQQIGCVYRKYPEINNASTRLPIEDFRKLVIASADPANTFSTSTFSFRLLSSSTSNDSCGSTSASCTPLFTFSNPSSDEEKCDYSTENHKICIRRDYCTKLNNECATNQINIQIAQLANLPTNSYEALQNQCDNVIRPACNAKFGLFSTTSKVVGRGDNGVDSNAYGWFNEACITSGFATKLRKVYAYNTASNIQGKCVIDATKKKADADCSAGGKKPDCPCLEYTGSDMAATYIRNETPREAGLCIDLPLAKTCPAIVTNPSPNPNSLDPYYINSSLNQTIYGLNDSQINNVVHISHKNRALDNLYGHADFAEAMFGISNVKGTCNGFWDYTSVNNVKIRPTINCINNDGNAVWSSVSNPCVRPSCQAITTNTSDQNGNYAQTYIYRSDPNDQKGLFNGFATWGLTQSADFPVTVNANSCIAGYKKIGSSAIMSNGETNATHAALYGNITGYLGGTSPTRSCNQVGGWEVATNSCQRISCAAINPPIPTSSSDSASWELWRNSGGATFPSALASISSTLVDGSITNLAATSYGTCNNTLGFFQASPLIPPSRTCDHLGNWGPVQNPCVTQCSAITCVQDNGTSTNCIAYGSSNGYATWPEITNVAISGEADGSFGACINGRSISAYPPLMNKYGVAYTLTDSTANYLTTIPRDVKNDTRTADSISSYSGYKPQRVCKSVITVGGTANVWTGVSSSCVSGCPSATEDPRINAGKTRHNVSSNVTGSNVSGGVITIDWPSTSFGSWAFVDSSSVTTQDASQYYHGRTNGQYSLARYCNPVTHKWDDAVATCVSNSGIVKTSPPSTKFPNNVNAYATYSSPTRVAAGVTTISSPSTDIGASTNSGTCITGSYSNNNGNQVAPAISCSYKDNNNRIDETYFNTEGDRICNAKCRSKTPTDPNQASGDGIFGVGSYDNSSGEQFKYFDVGSRLDLVCKSNYGSVIIGGSRNNPFSGCGRSSASDRSQNNPYVTCVDNGDRSSSWGSVYNDCSACRGCNSSSPFNLVAHNNNQRMFSNTVSCIGDTDTSRGRNNPHCYYLRSSDNDANACYSGQGYSNIGGPQIPTMINGKIIYFCNRVGNSADSTGAFGLRCLDGTIDIKVACDDGQNYCRNDDKNNSVWSEIEDNFPDNNPDNWIDFILF